MGSSGEEKTIFYHMHMNKKALISMQHDVEAYGGEENSNEAKALRYSKLSCRSPDAGKCSHGTLFPPVHAVVHGLVELSYKYFPLEAVSIRGAGNNVTHSIIFIGLRLLTEIHSRIY